jgi:hypothetical protein
MNEEQIALARRAVACKGWRWMLGCRVAHIEYGDITTDGRGTYLGGGMQPGDMCIHWDDHAPRGLSSNWSSPQNFRPAPHVFDYCIPDLTDPATMGCLLALVREAWGPVAHAMPWGHSSLSPAPVGWSMMLTAYDNLPTAKLSAPTEAGALVAALEAAP